MALIRLNDAFASFSDIFSLKVKRHLVRSSHNETNIFNFINYIFHCYHVALNDFVNRD